MSGLVTLGETLGLVSTGPLAHCTAATIGIGGAESNVAIGVRRLGGLAVWVGRVGDDAFGHRVLRELRAEDLGLLGRIDPDAPTGLMVKESCHPGSRVWYYRAGSAGSRLCPDDLTPGAVEAAKILHLTGITPGLSCTALAATRAALMTAQGCGVPVSFDVNHRPGVWGTRDPVPVYRELAGAARVLFAGVDEARLLTGAGTAQSDELLPRLAAATNGDVVLKLGADGCLARVDGTTYAIPGLAVAPVDTVGAGDAFVAGYLAELLAGRPAVERLRTAVQCGGFACLSLGDWEGLPTRRDLDALDRTDPVVR